MEFRVLGAVEALEDGLRISLGGPKQRSLLAMLLLEPNRAVSTDRLVDGLWGDDPPHRPAATLQVYVSNLRKILEPDRGPRGESSVLVTQPPGYRLAVDPDQIDLFRFERLVGVARTLWSEECIPGAALLFREALSLWREAPLADLSDEPWARPEVPRLEEARTGALEDLVDAELALGRDVELLPELETLVTRHPYRERLRRQLMLALYRSGRQADALAAYQAARQTLVDELGLEPSRELREMEAAILVHEPELAARATAPMNPADVVRVLTAIDGAPRDDAVVDAIIEEGRHSARRAEEALRQAVARERTTQLSNRVEGASATHAELVRTRHAIADRVLDRRSRNPLDHRAMFGSCPYKGLLRFEPEDAAWYFGRERTVAELLATVASSRCTSVVGASGSGKSSLTRAGLLAALGEDALPGSAAWPCLLLTPGADPVLELARALAPLSHATSANDVRDRLLEDPASLAAFADRARDRANGADGGSSVMIVVDQLEEVFTLCRDESVRARFLDVLVHAACDPDSPTKVLAAIRSDYYDRCAEHTAFAELVGQANLLVGPMRPDELQRAIEAPAQRAGLTLEDGLLDRIFDDVGREPGSLPLLETALLETWNRRSGNTLTLEGYAVSGGVHGAVAHLADDAYGHLSPSEQDIARGLFLRLAEPGVGTDDVRRRAPLDELIVDDEHAAVLAMLVDRRLVVTDDATAEVAHEALLREWPRLRTWLEEDREGRRIQRSLSNAAQDWALDERDHDLLFRGSRLAAALDVADAHPAQINPVERDFLTASRAQQESELTAARHTARRFRRLTVGLAVLLVLAIVAGVLSFVERSRARQQAEVSDATAVAANARSLVAERLDLALLLGVEAHRLHPSVETEGALEAVLASAPAGIERVLTLDPPAALFPSISPDGRLLASAGTDGLVRIHDASNGRVLRRLDGPRIVDPLGTLFSADGGRLAVGTEQGRITVWDVATGRRVATLPTRGEGPAYAVFDPTDGNRLFTVRHDGTVERWDLSVPRDPRSVDLFAVPAALIPTFPLVADVSMDGRRLMVCQPLVGPTSVWDIDRGTLLAVVPGTPCSFGNDGQTVTTTHDGMVTVWDAATGQQVGTPLTGLSDLGVYAQRSPDGKQVVVTEIADHRVRILDSATGRDVIPPVTLHASDVTARFLADGRLFTASADRIVMLRPSAPLVAPLGKVLEGNGPNGRASFTRDGSRVVSFNSSDGSRLWDTTGGALIQQFADPSGRAGHVIPAPDLHAAAVVDPDGAVRLVDLQRDDPAVLLSGNNGTPTSRGLRVSNPLYGLAWSPDGSMLAVGHAPSTVLWRVDEPANPRRIARLGAVGDVEFSPDGHNVVVVEEDKATVFEVGTGDRRRVFAIEPGRVMSAVAFSPDGQTLAATLWPKAAPRGGNGDAVLFDVTTGSVRSRLPIAYYPNGIAYLQDGRRLVILRVEFPFTGTSPGASSIEIRDAASLRTVGEPLAVPAAAHYLDASADGSRVTHGSESGFAVVWDLDPEHWEDLACRIAGRQLTPAEWRRYLPGRDYSPACRG